ncbi:MAG: hypothetical protein GC129_07125 [Proteobacteria bacterium]|nr:hypothetical protein [Pseudomonadota bacterium]
MAELKEKITVTFTSNLPAFPVSEELVKEYFSTLMGEWVERELIPAFGSYLLELGVQVVSRKEVDPQPRKGEGFFYFLTHEPATLGIVSVSYDLFLFRPLCDGFYIRATPLGFKPYGRTDSNLVGIQLLKLED